MKKKSATRVFEAVNFITSLLPGMSRYLLVSVILAASASARAQEKITWQDHIRPIFENRCTNCHNADKKKGDLDLSTYAGLIAGGSGGASVEAGDSAGSTLWKVVSHTDEPVMPPKGDKMPQAEIDLIAKWITGGLLDTPDGTAKVRQKASFAMAASASTARPEGPPPLPEHLLLEPVVTPARPNVAVGLAHSPWAPLTAVAAPRQVLLYNTVSGELLGVLPFPGSGTPEALSFSRNGALLLAGGGIAGKAGTLVVWEVKTGHPLINLTMNDDFDTILAADISADLSRIAMGGPGRRVRIYDTRTSQLIANIKKHTDWVTALAFSPDGVLLATGDRNGGLYVWEAGSGNEFQNFRDHEKMIAALAWRADSNVLAAGSEDGNMTWWEMANGTQVKKIASHGGVLALGYATDGRLVSGGRDGHVRIWDASGKQLRDWVPSGGSAVLKSIFSDDGQRVVTGAWNGEIKVQDAGSDAPGLLLAGNPPGIDHRLAALESTLPKQQSAVLQAVETLTAKEKAVTAADADLAGQLHSQMELGERWKEAAGRVDQSRAEAGKIEESRKGLIASLEAARKELAAPPKELAASPAPPSGPAAAPAAATAEARTALDQATAAEVTLVELAKSVQGQKIAALEEAVKGCDAALAKCREQAVQADQETKTLQKEKDVITQAIPLREKAAAGVKQEQVTAAGAVEAAKAQLGALDRSLARWKAARQQRAALVLRTEARVLKEKLEGLRAELAPLEAAVSTAPPGPQAQRITELQGMLATLPAESEAKQKAADTAWQQYLSLLPK